MGQSSSTGNGSTSKKAKWELKRIVKIGNDGDEVEFYVMYGKCQVVIPAADVDQDETIKRFFKAAMESSGGEANLFSVNAQGERLYYYFESDFKNGIGTCLQEVATRGNPHISNTFNMQTAQNLNDPRSIITFPVFEEKFNTSVLFANDKSTEEESSTDIGTMHFYTLEDTNIEFVKDLNTFSNEELDLLGLSLIYLVVAMLKAGVFDDKMKLKLYRKDNQARGFLFLSNSKTISQECRNAFLRGNNLEEMFANVLKEDSDVCSEEDKKLVFETKERFDEIYQMLNKAKKPEPEMHHREPEMEMPQ